MLVNKSDVIDRVAGTADVGRAQAERVLDAFFETVRGAVKKGDRVAWPGFGSFSVTQRKARTGRNPRTGEAVKIRASKALKFSSGSALKEYLNGGAAGKAAGAKKPAAKKASAAKKAPAKATAGKKATKATKAAKAKKR
ncbi:MAG TPA: HU family DNA-binding protein [Acidimicrobiales bacterium]|nr:HU family DNA-binding protein [Acidimicrobiales bacterium]